MEIGYLADYRDAIPTLAECFHREWSHFYPERTVQDVMLSVSARANRDRLPLALVAHRARELLGSVSLKIHDMGTRTDLSPWLASLYVMEQHRRQGIGSALVRAAEDAALALDVGTLYLLTPASEIFYAKLGWQRMTNTKYHGYAVTIMTKELGKTR